HSPRCCPPSTSARKSEKSTLPSSLLMLTEACVATTEFITTRFAVTLPVAFIWARNEGGAGVSSDKSPYHFFLAGCGRKAAVRVPRATSSACKLNSTGEVNGAAHQPGDESEPVQCDPASDAATESTRTRSSVRFTVADEISTGPCTPRSSARMACS